MFENLLSSIIEISITTSFIIGFLLVISPLIKKIYTAKWRYYVWIIISIRLLIPFNFSLSSPPINISAPSNAIVFNQPIVATPEKEMPANTEISPLNAYNNNISLIELFSLIWVTGIAIFIIFHFVTYISFKKQVKRWSSKTISSEIILIFNGICDQLNIKKKPTLLICKKISSPMIVGFLKPILLLPNESFNPLDLEVILKHELIHYKRKDILYKLILLLSNAIHWFNPLVYLMLKSANNDLEICCDNEVIKNSDIAFRKSYSQAILTALSNEKLHCSSLSTHFNSNKNTIKNRFLNIFDMSKKKKGVFTLCIVLLITIISGVFVACTEKSSEQNTQGKTVSELLYANKTQYVGDNSKVIAILDLLMIPTDIVRDSVSLETKTKPYTITINYKSSSLSDNNQDEFWQQRNAIILFSLIDNVDKIIFNINKDQPTQLEITRAEAEALYGGGDLREFSKTQESFNSFLEKVNFVGITPAENTPFKGLELYVWKNKELTSSDDTYFTLLIGTDRIKFEDEIYDLSVAVKDINKVTELLSQYSKESNLFIMQMNTTDFTKDEMIEIADTLEQNTGFNLVSIGLYQGTDNKVKFSTIDEAIHYGIMKKSQGRYGFGEFTAEGHVNIDVVETDSEIKVYSVVAASSFQFLNGSFVVVGGSGASPVVINLKKDGANLYEFIELIEPMDGGMWEKSIKEMYPENLWNKIFPIPKEVNDNLDLQINTQATEYLKSIGKNSEIKSHREEILEISSNILNRLEEIRKQNAYDLSRYPFYIGTKEWIEDGTRFIYENYQTKSDDGFDILGFRKTNEKGEIIEEFQYKITDDDVTKIKLT